MTGEGGVVKVFFQSHKLITNTLTLCNIYTSNVLEKVYYNVKKESTDIALVNVNTIESNLSLYYDTEKLFLNSTRTTQITSSY